MRLRSLLSIPALLLASCGGSTSTDPAASFATWLAGLPAPVATDAFGCTYAISGDVPLIGSRTGLRAGGVVAADAEGRLHIDCDVEITPPDLPVGGGAGGIPEFRVGTVLTFDGEKAWMETRTDSGWLEGAAKQQGFDLSATVMTVQAATVQRVLDSVFAMFEDDPSFAAVREEIGMEETMAPGTFGPAYWVHMVGRRSKVVSFRRGSSSVEVAFGLELEDLSMMPESFAAVEEAGEVDGNEVSLRMIFDLETGFTRAIRLEVESKFDNDSVYVRIDLGEISGDAPDSDLFRYTANGRTEMPLDALIMPILGVLPQPADSDLDF